MPGLVDKVGIGGHGIHLTANGLELFILVGQILQLCGTNEGKVGGIEEKHTPLTQNIFSGHHLEIIPVKGIGAEIGYFLVDHGHRLIPPKIVLVAKGADCPHLVTGANGKLCSGFIIGIQMGILNAVLGFQTDPLNIVFFGHGMGH